VGASLNSIELICYSRATGVWTQAHIQDLQVYNRLHSQQTIRAEG